MCVFKYSLNLTKQKQNYFLVCWYYFYYLLTYSYILIYIVFCCAAFYTLLSITVIVLLVFVWLPLIEKIFFIDHRATQTSNLPHASRCALGRSAPFFSLLLSLSFIQELIRFLWPNANCTTRRYPGNHYRATIESRSVSVLTIASTLCFLHLSPCDHWRKPN